MDCNPEINDIRVHVAENSVKEMANHAISNSNIEKNDEGVVSNEMVEKHLNEMMKRSQEIYTGEGQFTTIDRMEFPLQKDQSSKEITDLLEDSATNKTVLPNQQNVILVKIPTQYLEYICQFCSKDFSRNLAKHILIHTGQRPYQCDLCGKKFRYGNTLKRHQRIHTGEAPFPCPVCNKAFFSNGELHNHSVIHTDSNRTSDDFVQPNSNVSKKETKYTCEICGVKFVHGATYQKHSLIYHEKSIPKTWSRAPRLKKVKSNVKHVKTTADDELTESIKELIQKNEQFLIKTEPL
ncbi:unnamed protein product [Mytilus edulis]|uniref:C2H2-type domain-containing protein n=1 Tax=Mytilus edulis TaxID=6550 RepID=A0A8S3RIT6_MYTED|nr:unnamed protein product [Mytilus edulis]